MLRPLPLWPLALACGLLPLLATHVAWLLSMDAGYVPACNPYLEGCTSISRAARHGLGNHLFRLAVLPVAVAMMLHWWSCRRWLAERQADARTGGSLPTLGAVAGVSLAIYTAFLGTEGAIYEWLRRYGIYGYFGGTALAQLVFLRALRGLAIQRGIANAMTTLVAGMLVLGLGSVAVTAVVVDDTRRESLENIMEWLLGLAIVAWFVLHAELWRRERVAVAVVTR